MILGEVTTYTQEELLYYKTLTIYICNRYTAALFYLNTVTKGKGFLPLPFDILASECGAIQHRYNIAYYLHENHFKTSIFFDRTDTTNNCCLRKKGKSNESHPFEENSLEQSATLGKCRQKRVLPIELSASLRVYYAFIHNFFSTSERVST